MRVRSQRPFSLALFLIAVLHLGVWSVGVTQNPTGAREFFTRYSDSFQNCGVDAGAIDSAAVSLTADSTLALGAELIHLYSSQSVEREQAQQAAGLQIEWQQLLSKHIAARLDGATVVSTAALLTVFLFSTITYNTHSADAEADAAARINSVARIASSICV